jgi:hypothetical protein
MLLKRLKHVVVGSEGYEVGEPATRLMVEVWSLRIATYKSPCLGQDDQSGCKGAIFI